MTPQELAVRGIQMSADGRDDAAHDHFHRALLAEPDNLAAMAGIRDLLCRRRAYETALVYAKRIVALAPNDGVQWDRVAGIYMSMDRFGEARPAVERALELAPDNPLLWHQAALLEHRVNDPHRALELAARALELNPYGVDLANDVMHFRLAIGDDLSSALDAYEARWDTLIHLRPWDLHLPEWKGEHLIGKRVLLHSEQGLGDAIMMARFARDLVARGAELVGLCLPDDLTRLFEAQRWERVRVVDIAAVEADGWDCQTPMYSALRHLRYGRSDIDPRPYLVAPKIVVPPLPEGYRVGLCWASGRWNMDTGLRRMAPLVKLLRLAEIPGVRLVSLQKGDDARDIAALGAEALVADPTPVCDDFAATAAVIAKLDAVVTVDTSVLHVAAALGKPTFMMCQFTKCWRWWGSPSGRPWYDSLVISKQVASGVWDEPINAAYDWVAAGCR